VRVAVCVLILAACAARPAALEPAAKDTPWCMRVLVRKGGSDLSGLACGETQGLCEQARKIALSLGGVAGLSGVGQCRQGEK